MADIEPAPVLECTKCKTDLTARSRPLCEGCVDDACEAVTVDCAICGKHDADTCYDCGEDLGADKVLEYAQRRKALGFMTPEVFAAFELFADDLRAGDA